MDRGGRQRDAWDAVREALGVSAVRRSRDGGGREEREARVMVVVVVPAEESLQPSTSMDLSVEAPWIVELVLHGLELSLAEGVVVLSSDPRGRLKLHDAPSDTSSCASAPRDAPFIALPSIADVAPLTTASRHCSSPPRGLPRDGGTHRARQA